MLLAIDVGNTNIVLGVYRDAELTHHWRVSTDRSKTGDEYGMLFTQLFRDGECNPAEIDGVIITSVVPSVNDAILLAVRKYFRTDPLVVRHGLKMGLVNGYDNPEQLGTDRFVNAVAAYHLYGGPVIVVDFGTAMKFEAVTEGGKYLGGIICPGIRSAAESLFRFTDKLPRIELVKPATVIGRNTVHGMQSGLIHGYVGLVNHLVRLLRAEMGADAPVVATGGLAGLIATATETIGIINPDLTLEGLRIIYTMNRP